MSPARPATPAAVPATLSADPSTRPSVAAVQAGVFTQAQALAEGWTARQVTRRLERGRWRRLLGDGLVEPIGQEPGLLQKAWAIHLTWPDVVISHLSAGRLFGFPVSGDGDLHVISERPPQRLRGDRAPGPAGAEGTGPAARSAADRSHAHGCRLPRPARPRSGVRSVGLALHPGRSAPPRARPGRPGQVRQAGHRTTAPDRPADGGAAR